MARITSSIIVGMGLLLCCAAIGAKYSIPVDQVDGKKVYYGLPSQFDKPGEVRYEEVIRATPEYKAMKKEKVKRGTGRYWILLSEASNRTVRGIARVGEDSDYDLITESGYLGSLNPAIEADDITANVVKVVAEDTQKKDAPQKDAQKKGAPKKDTPKKDTPKK